MKIRMFSRIIMLLAVLLSTGWAQTSIASGEILSPVRTLYAGGVHPKDYVFEIINDYEVIWGKGNVNWSELESDEVVDGKRVVKTLSEVSAFGLLPWMVMHTTFTFEKNGTVIIIAAPQTVLAGEIIMVHDPIGSRWYRSTRYTDDPSTFYDPTGELPEVLVQGVHRAVVFPSWRALVTRCALAPRTCDKDVNL